MKLQITALALALVAVPAFASPQGDDAKINNDTHVSNDIHVRGGARVTGHIRINSESSSVIDQDQATTFNAMQGDGDATASISNRVARDAQGNIGLNVAAGVGNAQTNDVALSAVDGRRVFASAMSFNNQGTFENYGTGGTRRDVDYRATVDGNVLANAKGNIGVNVAAGVGNAQSNSLAASVNTSGTIAKATADSQQLTLLNMLEADCGDLDSTASLAGGALQGAQGNIGVNIAAGVGNAQHNGLSIAVAQGGACSSCGP
ncbi:cell surface protein [Lysobacter sp. HDW10]|uniref:cell surface protein n=1 Tax=Lysobacter sp. HDW10 TaxID=2714936 RepID=UPI00140BBAAB|nr:cell surface protein [Lysobacter sp. HDW10]QIK80783.1 cell surface protein [Lysobacter sp. HDW10]